MVGAGCIVSCLLMVLLPGGEAYTASEDEVRFDIREYRVMGNTLLDYETIMTRMVYYTGLDMSASDVEKARQYLEGLYHSEGYPTVMVNIPPQNIEQGVVTLEVIESRIGMVRVTGNRYYTREKILSKLPSFRRGEIMYIPKIQAEINKSNRSPDLKITPMLMPGRDFGTTDVELKVVDHFPLHGSIELNNRATWDTTRLRLNGIIRYDNLWQKEHGLTFQYQTSPKDSSEVKVYALSYVLPAPWDDDHIIAAYGVLSDSDTAFGEGFETVGEGKILGLQYVIPLPFYKSYAQNLSLGVDYKDFKEKLGFSDSDSGESDTQETPVTYLPLSLRYQGTLYGDTGRTGFDAGVSVAFRGLVTDRDEFETKRYKARGNYMILRLGADRDQQLPLGFSMRLMAEGQIADQPLIANEQYSAGGMKSVRGYRENEEAGDDALFATLELKAPDCARLMGAPEGYGFIPFLFVDGARLKIQDALPGEDAKKGLYGAGLGFRGSLSRFFEYDCSCGWALRDTGRTDRGDSLFNFAVKAQF